MTTEAIISKLARRRFSLDNEKQAQKEIHDGLLEFIDPVAVTREYVLAPGSIIDIFVRPDIGIEVKLKGSKRDIYRQIKRYCDSPVIKHIILFTNLSIGLPDEINGKPCTVITLSKAWL